MRRLWLHAGPSKTGSTALQRFLMHNRARLRAAGYCYPHETPRLINSWAHEGIYEVLVREWGYLNAVEPRAYLARVREELDCSSTPHAILSFEGFSITGKMRPHLKTLFDAFPDHEVHLVYYLRQQEDWAKSAYAQDLRHGRTQDDYAAFLETRRPIYHFPIQLKPWLEALPDERIHLRIFAREPGIERDFLGCLGLDAGGLEFLPPQNESFSRALLDFALLLDRLGVKLSNRHALWEALRGLLPSQGPQPAWASLEVRRAFQDEFAETNRAIARRFFGRDALFPPLKDRPVVPWPALTTDQLVQAFAMAMEFERQRYAAALQEARGG